METSLAKKVSRIYCRNYDQAKVNACLKISIYGEVVTASSKCIYKIHDVGI
jgi:hypothetical protein